MTTTARRPSSKHKPTRRRSLRPWLLGLLFGSLLVAAGTVWWIGHRARSPIQTPQDVAVIAPPVLELGGVDAAVARAIEAARAAVQQSPRSAQSWGQLGKVLLAHSF